jgi:hypothetical protein
MEPSDIVHQIGLINGILERILKSDCISEKKSKLNEYDILLIMDNVSHLEAISRLILAKLLLLEINSDDVNK